MHSLKIRILMVLILFAFSCVSKAHARIELSFSSPPSEIQSDQTIQIDVTLSGASPDAEYFIRGVFYKPDSSQYFGYTQNNDGEWEKDSNNSTKFYKITGNTTKSITFKPDLDSSNFNPNAGYLFKVGRYTPGGSLTWSEQTPATVYITTTASITPTPLNTITTTVTPSPTQALSVTATPTLSVIPTQTIDPSALKLSEIMACPNANEEEWVEIKNITAEKLSIHNWKLKDSTETRSVAVEGNISSYGYLVIPISTSVLNNGGYSVRLFNEHGQLIDQMSYTNCSTGTSFIKLDNQWHTTKIVSKGSTNEYQPLVSNTPHPTTTAVTITPTPTLMDEHLSNTQNIREELSSIVDEYTDSVKSEVNTVYKSEAQQEDTQDSTISAQPEHKTNTFASQSNAFLLGGCSYIITAALLAQKWYTIASA